MRLTLSVFGRELISVEATRDTDDEPETPRTFGFHASGVGVLERCDDAPIELTE